MDKHELSKPQDPEKGLELAEHNEHIGTSLSASSSTDAAKILDVEDISYGQNGIKGLASSPYIFGATFLASLGGFSFGYDQGVISLILVMDQFRDQFPECSPDSPSYSFNTGLMTAMLELGAFVGCLAYPWFADRYSRKWGISGAVAFFIVGAIIQTASNDYATLVAGRTIGGIGVGTLASGAPLYISEIAPPNLRGSLLVLEQFSICIGAIVSYWLCYGTQYIDGQWAWRLPFLLQMPSAIVVGTLIHVFPYSPRWLSMKGRDDEALKSVARLRSLPETDGRVQMEWKGIMAETRFDEAMSHKMHGDSKGLILELKSWGALFTKKYWRRTAIAMAIPFFQQFVGIDAFVYYAPTFFTELGQTDEMARILAGIINVAQFAGICITCFYLDKMGRRPLAIWGAIAMMICHIVVAALNGQFGTSWTSHASAGWACVAFIYAFIFFFGLSYGPLGWTLPAEIWPSSLRSKGTSLAVAINWGANFIIGLVAPPMLENIGYGTYIFFAVFCFLAAVFSYCLVPETTGKTLEQMDAVFGDETTAETEELHREIALQIAKR